MFKVFSKFDKCGVRTEFGVFDDVQVVMKNVVCTKYDCPIINVVTSLIIPKEICGEVREIE